MKPLSLSSILLLEASSSNAEEIETRRSLRAIRRWRHFLPPWLLLQFSSCSLFTVSLGFSRKFALQKLSISIIQFKTKLSHEITLFWKYVTLLLPVQSHSYEEYSKASSNYIKCQTLEEVDWEGPIHDIVSCFKKLFNLQMCWKVEFTCLHQEIYLTLVAKKRNTQTKKKYVCIYIYLYIYR